MELNKRLSNLKKAAIAIGAATISWGIGGILSVIISV